MNNRRKHARNKEEGMWCGVSGVSLLVTHLVFRGKVRVMWQVTPPAEEIADLRCFGTVSVVSQ